MKKTIAIACKTLQDEVMIVGNELNITYPIIWIESGLHTTPERLRKVIQEQINRIDNVDNILLIFGICGNSLFGLHSAKARIIFPKVDDCISLFLGGNSEKAKWERKSSGYYLTKGYLKMESNIWTDYQQCLAKYGLEKTRRLMKKMLDGYEKLRIITTGAYNLEDILDTSKDIAKKLELDHEVIEGSLHLVYKALQGIWDEDFAVIEPGHAVGFEDVGLG